MGLLGCEWVAFHLLIDLLDHFLIHLPLLVKHIITLFILNLTRICAKQGHSLNETKRRAPTHNQLHFHCSPVIFSNHNRHVLLRKPAKRVPR